VPFVDEECSPVLIQRRVHSRMPIGLCWDNSKVSQHAVSTTRRSQNEGEMLRRDHLHTSIGTYTRHACWRFKSTSPGQSHHQSFCLRSAFMWREPYLKAPSTRAAGSIALPRYLFSFAALRTYPIYGRDLLKWSRERKRKRETKPFFSECFGPTALKDTIALWCNPGEGDCLAVQKNPSTSFPGFVTAVGAGPSLGPVKLC
jgi:hypothetical protein